MYLGHADWFQWFILSFLSLDPHKTKDNESQQMNLHTKLTHDGLAWYYSTLQVWLHAGFSTCKMTKSGVIKKMLR